MKGGEHYVGGYQVLNNIRIIRMDYNTIILCILVIQKIRGSLNSTLFSFQKGHNQVDRKWLLRTAGWGSIALGIYLIHLGTDNDAPEFKAKGDILDAEFTVLED